MTEAEQIVEASRVPNTKIFFLGCFESRVTVLSQQRRALNLIDAMLETKMIRPQNGRVAIVGGGASGMTAAVGLAVASPGITVDLFERESDLLHLQLHSDRGLHPFIYDWPASGSTESDAGLPLLNWRAGRAREVTRQIVAGFDAIRRDKQNLVVRPSSFVTGLDPVGEIGCRILVSKQPLSGVYDAVILAIGFGYERRSNTGKHDSYWKPSELLGPPGDSPVIFISGNGDGGLVDFTMAAFNRLEHEEIVRFIVEHSDLDDVKEHLLQIERAAWKGKDYSTDIFAEYGSLKIPSELMLNVHDRLRDADVWLHTREPGLFRRKSAILNRFTAFLAIYADKTFGRNRIHVRPAIEHKELPDGSVTVGQDTLKPSIPIFRFGPESMANIQPFKQWYDLFSPTIDDVPQDYQAALPDLTSSARIRFSTSRTAEVAKAEITPAERSAVSTDPRIEARSWLDDHAVEFKPASLSGFIISGAAEPVRWLLQAGLPPDTMLGAVSPLELALQQFDLQPAASSFGGTSEISEPDADRVDVLRALVSAHPRGVAQAAHDALAKPNPARLIALMRAGVSLDAIDTAGHTLAAQSMRKDSDESRGVRTGWTELLVREGPPAPPSLATWMLLWAAATGRERLVTRLLDQGLPVDSTLHADVPSEPIEELEKAFWWPGGSALHRLLANAQRPYAAFYAETEIYSIEMLRLLLKRGASPAAVDARGYTPLHIAAHEGLDQAAALLLAAPGVDLERLNDEGETALRDAIVWPRSRRIAQVLMSRWIPDDPAERAKLLHRAARSRDEGILRALLDAGCDPNGPVDGASRPLTALAQYSGLASDRPSSVPCMALLLDHGANPALPNEDGWTALHWFAQGDELDAVDRLLESSVDAELADRNRLIPLMVCRSAAIAQRLLAAGTRPTSQDRYGFDALDHAAINGSSEVVALLGPPERAPRPEARMVRAIMDRDTELVGELLAAGVSANMIGPAGRPVLNSAARVQVADILGLLLDHGAEIDARDACGSTALNECLCAFRTTVMDHEACLTLLLDRGASTQSVDRPGDLGEAAVFRGTLWWKLDTVSTRLLSKGGNARSREGATSLMIAAKWGNARQIDELLCGGLDPNAVDDDGCAPLHYAADGPGLEDDGEYAKKVELLIRAGADIDTCDNSGETPLFKAVRSGHFDVIDLLLERGADPRRRNAREETLAKVALRSNRVPQFNRFRALSQAQ